jgi:hypothetical protein
LRHSRRPLADQTSIIIIGDCLFAVAVIFAAHLLSHELSGTR